MKEPWTPIEDVKNSASQRLQPHLELRYPQETKKAFSQVVGHPTNHCLHVKMTHYGADIPTFYYTPSPQLRQSEFRFAE